MSYDTHDTYVIASESRERRRCGVGEQLMASRGWVVQVGCAAYVVISLAYRFLSLSASLANGTLSSSESAFHAALQKPSK